LYLLHVATERSKRRVLSVDDDGLTHAADVPLVAGLLAAFALAGAVAGGAKLGIPWTLNSKSSEDASLTAASKKGR
jgi:hypothetical protein